jgi:hypothetical protein
MWMWIWLAESNNGIVMSSYDQRRPRFRRKGTDHKYGRVATAHQPEGFTYFVLATSPAGNAADKGVVSPFIKYPHQVTIQITTCLYNVRLMWHTRLSSASKRRAFLVGQRRREKLNLSCIESITFGFKTLVFCI